MKIISVYILIVVCLYFFTKPYANEIEGMLKKLNLSTFDALWLTHIEGMAIGGIIMLIIS